MCGGCEQICCGLCIYRRQYGLRVCCGNDDDDDDVASAHHRGRRKTHIVLAAQQNRAFDDSVPGVDKSPTVIEENEASEHDDQKVNAETGDITVTPDAAADATDAEAVNRTRVADNDSKNAVRAIANDNNDDDVTSDHDANPPAATTALSDDNSASPPSRNPTEIQTPDGSADESTDSAPEPEAVFLPVPLQETENNRRTKNSPVHRRSRSTGEGPRRRRYIIDTTVCDKAVNVHGDDLMVVEPEPEPEIVTGSETDELSEATTNEGSRERGEQAVKEGSGDETTNKNASHAVSDGESKLADPRMFGNVVLDLDELGLLKPVDVKEEEVSDLYIQCESKNPPEVFTSALA